MKNRIKHSASLICLTLAVCAASASAQTQDAQTPLNNMRVLRSNIHANAENAELCLEFDRTLASLPSSRLSSALTLSLDGKKVTPQNVIASGDSLCLFPLERQRAYRLSVNGLRGIKGERMADAYQLDFSIPDRTPSLSFTGRNGGIDGFGTADAPLNLRIVNVPRATLEIYRVQTPEAMNAAWQDRAQAVIAPLESAYLARTKGQLVKKEDLSFAATRNAIQTMSISIGERLPNLNPGLYLAVVGTEPHDAKKLESKSLSPLTAVWLVKSDFDAVALRDGEKIHIFAANGKEAKGKAAVKLFDLQGRLVGETETAEDGQAMIPVSPKNNDAVSVVVTDAAGNLSLTDIERPAQAAAPKPAGSIRSESLFPAPGEMVNVTLNLPEEATASVTDSRLRLIRAASSYSDMEVPALTKGTARLSFAAPAQSGIWTMRWIGRNGAVLAEAPLRVTAHADAPRLNLMTSDDDLSGDLETTVTVKSLSSGGKPVPLTIGRLMAIWQKSDPATMGWKDYRFGLGAQPLAIASDIADFITDEQGTATLTVKVPPPPSEPGLYEAVLTTRTDPDLGVEDAAAITLPLHGTSNAVGIKPLAPTGHFAQNNAARFALIALTSDGKPRDLGGLSYQLYEEGRSFAWYQHEGRWTYRREPQLRPISGGSTAIRADGTSILEVPVTAGNYRLEILDGAGKVLTQTGFSAGWNVKMASAEDNLQLTAPTIVHPGHETVVKFSLPVPSMVFAAASDGQIRKITHERRAKGENTLSFVSTEGWADDVVFAVKAIGEDGIVRHGQLHLNGKRSDETAASSVPPALSPTAATTPEGVPLHTGDAATIIFDIENRGNAPEQARYTLATSAGLKPDTSSGTLQIEPRASRALPITVRATTAGTKELHLELSGDHAPKVTRTWRMAVLPSFDSFISGNTVTIPQQQTLAEAAPHAAEDKAVAFIARKPMTGFAELIAALLQTAPYTTRELAASITALHQWDDTIAQSGLAPDFFVASRRDEWLDRLLKRQNADGGFGSIRGEDSTIADTAAALTALATEESPAVQPARDLTIGWLKQKLANTWFDENEREARAAIYAALAVARAQDVPSLHYFSDTSLNARLSPEAQAGLAAAFKQIRAYDAAAFWIKKLLAEKGEGFRPSLLGALASTDALSSDETRKAASAMGAAIADGRQQEITDIAAILRALAADNASAGKAHILLDNQERGFHDAWAVRLGETSPAKVRNADPQPLYVTFAKETKATDRRSSVVRHIYRLNGVELSPQTRPAPGETYIVELTGAMPEMKDANRLLIHDRPDPSLRPLSCALSAKLHTLSFIPWFTTHDLTPVTTCEMSANAIDAVIPAGDDRAFRIVYFARMDGKAAAEFIPATARPLK